LQSLFWRKRLGRVAKRLEKFKKLVWRDAASSERMLVDLDPHDRAAATNRVLGAAKRLEFASLDVKLDEVTPFKIHGVERNEVDLARSLDDVARAGIESLRVSDQPLLVRETAPHDDRLRAVVLQALKGLWIDLERHDMTLWTDPIKIGSRVVSNECPGVDHPVSGTNVLQNPRKSIFVMVKTARLLDPRRDVRVVLDDGDIVWQNLHRTSSRADVCMP